MVKNKCWCPPVRDGSPQRTKGSVWLISALSSHQHEAVCAHTSSEWRTAGWMEGNPWEHIKSSVTENLRKGSFKYFKVQWDQIEKWSPHRTWRNETHVPITPGNCYTASLALTAFLPGSSPSLSTFLPSMGIVAITDYHNFYMQFTTEELRPV